MGNLPKRTFREVHESRLLDTEHQLKTLLMKQRVQVGEVYCFDCVGSTMDAAFSLSGPVRVICTC